MRVTGLTTASRYDEEHTSCAWSPDGAICIYVGCGASKQITLEASKQAGHTKHQLIDFLHIPSCTVDCATTTWPRVGANKARATIDQWEGVV
jgi:hypothetical protein